jgi:hypothetical protein
VVGTQSFLYVCPHARARDEWGYYRNSNDKSAVALLETAMSMHAGGDSFDWFFLAMAHPRLGDRHNAQMWLERAVQWMDSDKPNSDELRRFRAEAKGMLADLGKR